MSFDWTEFLALAEQLLEDSSTSGFEEASLRSAISRAYYAVFQIASTWACARGDYTKQQSGADHYALAVHFQSLPDSALRQVGIDMDRLRLDRRKADYDEVIRGSLVKLAESSVLAAQEALNTLNSRKLETPRAS